jgi:predicted amidophosphoribosyltransferase
MRYCAACASPLPIQACSACRRENFTGDRFCAFCARPLPDARHLPVVEGAAPPPATPNEASELLALAEDARARAEAVKDAPPPTTKRHLGQDDIDTLFGGAGA